MESTKTKTPVGRPPVLDGGKGGKRRGVYLDEASWQKATVLGNGQPSEGIRKALASVRTADS